MSCRFLVLYFGVFVGEFCSVIIRRYIFYPESFSLTGVATVKLKLSYEIIFAGNQLADCSIRLSGKYPFPKIYLDVNVLAVLQQIFHWLQLCRYKFPTPCMREIAHTCWAINVYLYFSHSRLRIWGWLLRNALSENWKNIIKKRNRQSLLF